jgi:LCP family protein required for cell wall assembly
MTQQSPMNESNVPTSIHNQPVYYAPPPPTLTRESAVRERVRRRRVRSRRGGEWAWVVIAGAMLGIVIVLSMGISLLIRTAQERQEVIPTAAAVLPTPLDARTSYGAASVRGENLLLSDGRSLALTPWNGTSRFTVLVMGLDRRPGEKGLAFRTDTMMLVSIDPATNSVGILSIPRDLFVEIPGYSELQRVNTSMVLGELRQPDFGPQLAIQTVQYNLGIRVHDYVAVDFQSFIKFIDAIGGLEMDIPYNISDPLFPDMNYGYDPFYIRAGRQILNGETALKYARTRHGDNDFLRAQRQQLVMYAVRDRLTDANRLPELIVQSPSLWAALQDGVYTGLTLDQIIQLGLFLKDVPEENIHTGVINEAYTVNYTTPQGAQVLIPDRARLGELMVKVFGETYSQ